MSQPVPVVFKGILVYPQERSGSRIRVKTNNQADAQKVGLPFKDLEGGVAVFEDWVEESELIPLGD